MAWHTLPAMPMPPDQSPITDGAHTTSATSATSAAPAVPTVVAAAPAPSPGCAAADLQRLRQRRRRQVLVGGGLLGLSAGLADLWARARAEDTGPEPDDGRPLQRGRAPVLFIGHGSPMNVVQDNAFTRHLRQWGKALGRPKAILVVSAHWLTEGEHQVSVDPANATLHDFGGFPAALYAQRYPAPGAPALAGQAAGRLGPRRAGSVQGRGLDHGAWTVLRHLVPAANVPVFQVSLDIRADGARQLATGRALAALRDQGVMLVGSGNVVHNLGDTQRGAPDSAHGLADWAEDFDQRVKAALDADDRAALAAYTRLGPHAEQAVPFPDHYHPLLVALGAVQAGERPQHVFEGFQSGTISMRCVQWGAASTA